MYLGIIFLFTVTKIILCQINLSDNNDMKIPDAFNVPIAGDCTPEGDAFCLRRVPNSFCSLEKNECFCKVGHVSVQDDGGTVCKILLTNAKCRLDSDCMDVKGSICHPGAGFCTCPQGTIFVSQRHQCMKRVHWSTKNDLCKMCKSVKGTCFQEDFDLSLNESSVLKFGCLCPGKNAMPTKFVDDFSNICEALLMDIGDFCNDQYLICRSAKSICKRRVGSIERICLCPPDYIPVYQYHLKYYECIPKLSFKEIGCQKCYLKGGQCYVNNQMSQKIQCDCGRLRNSPLRDLKISDSEEVCSNNLVQISCSNKRLQICYIPHQTPPYENLQAALKKNQARVFLTGDTSGNDEKTFHNANQEADDPSSSQNLCQLKLIKYTEIYLDEYCIDISLGSNVLPCGLIQMKYKNGNMYSGLLQIWTDSKFPTPSRDMKFEINCKSHPKKSTNQLGQSLDRTDSLQGKDFVNNVNIEFPNSPQITLKILNSLDHEITSIDIASAIKLDILLVDRNAEFNGIEVEACYVSNVSYSKFNPSIHSEQFIIDRGCSASNFPLFQNLFSDAKIPSTPVHLQSSLFPAFRVFPKDENVYFRCLLKVCRHTTWCKKATNCQEKKQRKSSTYNEGDVKFVVRTIKLQVKAFEDNLSNFKVNPKKSSFNQACQYPMCLSLGHLSMIAASFSIILLLTILLLILLYRKHFQQLRLFSPLSNEASHKLCTYNSNKCLTINQPLNNIDADDCYKEFMYVNPRQIINENYYEDFVTGSSGNPQYRIELSKQSVINDVGINYCLDNIYFDNNHSCLLDSYHESVSQETVTRCNNVISTSNLSNPVNFLHQFDSDQLHNHNSSETNPQDISIIS